MPPETLDFEEPIAVLLKEIEALSLLPATDARQREMALARTAARTVRADLYARAHAVAARPRRAPPEPSRPRRLHSTPVSRIHRNSRRSAIRRRSRDHDRLCRIPRRGGAARRTRQGSRYEGKDLPELRIRAAGGLSKGACARFAWPRSSAGRRSCSSTRRPHIPASTPRNAASPKRSPSTCAT